MKTFQFIDLFCGIGAFRVALESLGGKCVFSSDISTEAEKIYKHNFHEGYTAGDITKVKSKSIPDFDILCGGFPCQTFSKANQRRFHGDEEEIKKDNRTHLFKEIVRILRHKKPRGFILENTSTIFKFELFKEIIEQLRLTHDVHYVEMDGGDYVPQNRKRIFFVGTPKGCPLNWLPTIKPYPVIGSILEKDSELIAKGEWIPVPRLFVRNTRNNAIKNKRRSRERLRNGKTVCNFYSRTSIKTGQAATFARLDLNFKKITPYHLKLAKDKYRWFSTREMLRLFGFPESYSIPKSSNFIERRKCLGNSVVVPCIIYLARCLLHSIEHNTPHTTKDIFQ